MRLLVAINEDQGIESKLSEHFGHCPCFAILNSETKELKIVKNDLDHSNHNKTPVDQIMVHEPNAVFTLGMGQRAIKLFEEKGVELKTGKFTTLQEVLDNVDNLDDLAGGCNHEQH